MLGEHSYIQCREYVGTTLLHEGANALPTQDGDRWFSHRMTEAVRLIERVVRPSHYVWTIADFTGSSTPVNVEGFTEIVLPARYQGPPDFVHYDDADVILTDPHYLWRSGQPLVVKGPMLNYGYCILGRVFRSDIPDAASLKIQAYRHLGPYNGGLIASSALGNPVTITTSGAHRLTTGDQVTIADHATATQANGDWTVTVTGTTTFTVPVQTVANGSGGIFTLTDDPMEGLGEGFALLPAYWVLSQYPASSDSNIEMERAKRATDLWQMHLGGARMDVARAQGEPLRM